MMMAQSSSSSSSSRLFSSTPNYSSRNIPAKRRLLSIHHNHGPLSKIRIIRGSSSVVGNERAQQQQREQQQQQQEQQHWSSVSSDINTRLLASLPRSSPQSVADPLLQLVSAAPLSIAPALCLAACELVGGTREQAVLNVASAIQLMHAAVHTHSQLLLRSRRNINLAGGVQLMTGDGMPPLAYELAATAADSSSWDRMLRVIVEMTRTMGSQGGVLEGQLMEAEGEREDQDQTTWTWERKVGRLSACGAACGAIMGGGTDEDVERMRRFGMYVAMTSAVNDAQVFRSLARLELQGFEASRVESVIALFQLGDIL